MEKKILIDHTYFFISQCGNYQAYFSKNKLQQINCKIMDLNHKTEHLYKNLTAETMLELLVNFHFEVSTFVCVLIHSIYFLFRKDYPNEFRSQSCLYILL